MSRRQKLELTWMGKESWPKLEPRILLEEPAKSYHARHRVVNKVRCVVIDPPYNTSSGFEQDEIRWVRH